MSEKLQKFILGVVVLFICLILHQAYTGPIYQQALSSRSWPSTQGRVTKNEVNSTAGETRDLYQLEFSYAYVIDNQEYEGKTRYFDKGEGARRWKGDFYTFVAQYPVSAPIKVYYNPASPEESTIITGFHWSAWLVIGFNVLLLFIGVSLILFPSLWHR